VEWECLLGDKPIRFTCYDFAGQDVYYATHQLFLSNDAVYIVAWHPRRGVKECNLDFWLRSIQVRAKRAQVIVVATHHDQKISSRLEQQDFERRFPSLRLKFTEMSSSSSHGVDALKTLVFDMALALEHIGFAVLARLRFFSMSDF